MKKHIILVLLLILTNCGQSNKEKIVGSWVTFSPDVHAIEFMKEGEGIIHYENSKIENIKYEFIGDEELRIKSESSRTVFVRFSNDGKTLFLENRMTSQKTKYNLVPNIEELKTEWELNKGVFIIASIAQQYYRKPKELGGGGNSFDGFEIFPKLKKQTYTKYRFKQISDTMMVITGTTIKECPKKSEVTVSPFRILPSYYKRDSANQSS